jgi:hypothetical protein
MMQRVLQGERDRVHQLTVEINEAYSENKLMHTGQANETLKKELAGLQAELTIARHQYQNLKYRNIEQQELF